MNRATLLNLHRFIPQKDVRKKIYSLLTLGEIRMCLWAHGVRLGSGDKMEIAYHCGLLCLSELWEGCCMSICHEQQTVYENALVEGDHEHAVVGIWKGHHLFIAAKYNSIKCLKRVSSRASFCFSAQEFHDQLYTAIGHGSTDVFKFMYKRLDPEYINAGHVVHCVRYKRLEILHWLYDNYSRPVFTTAQAKTIQTHVEKYRNRDLAIWFLLRGAGRTVVTPVDDPFIWSVHLDITLQDAR